MSIPICKALGATRRSMSAWCRWSINSFFCSVIAAPTSTGEWVEFIGFVCLSPGSCLRCSVLLFYSFCGIYSGATQCKHPVHFATLTPLISSVFVWALISTFLSASPSLYFSLFLSSGQAFGFMGAALRPAGATAWPSLCPPCPAGLWLSATNWEESLQLLSTMDGITRLSVVHQSISINE